MTTSLPEIPAEIETKRCILVVDDDDEVRRGLRCVLQMEGYEVVTAPNGRQAIAAFCERRCDLVLLDMNMPLQNGWGTIAELRRLKGDVPVIFITARPDQRTLARETGVGLMEKPLDLPLLLRRIRSLLTPGEPVASNLPG